MDSLFTSKRKDKYKFSYIVLLIVVLLSFCMLVGSVVAWLTRTYSYRDNDNLIGSVEMKIYRNNQEITGTVSEIDGVTKWRCNTPYVVNAGTLTRNNIGLTMRNVGTVDALVRVTLSIYYIDDYDNVLTETDKRPAILVSNSPTLKGTIKLSTENWVYDFAGDGAVATGYMYYDTKLSPYSIRVPNVSGPGYTTSVVASNDISIINQFEVSEVQKNTIFYIDITVDAVAYDGNIYKKIENGETSNSDIPVYALPFGKKESLPESWEAWK